MGSSSAAWTTVAKPAATARSMVAKGSSTSVSRAISSKRPMPPGAAGTELPMLATAVTSTAIAASCARLSKTPSRPKEKPTKKKSRDSSSQMGSESAKRSPRVPVLLRGMKPSRNMRTSSRTLVPNRSGSRRSPASIAARVRAG